MERCSLYLQYQNQIMVWARQISSPVINPQNKSLGYEYNVGLRTIVFLEIFSQNCLRGVLSAQNITQVNLSTFHLLPSQGYKYVFGDDLYVLSLGGSISLSKPMAFAVTKSCKKKIIPT